MQEQRRQLARGQSRGETVKRILFRNSFSARLKPMENLTGHWAKWSVCDEKTGQMVIEMGRKRKMDSSDEQSNAKTIKTSADMSSGGISLSDWCKQVGSVKQKNIQESDPSTITQCPDNIGLNDDDDEVVIDCEEELADNSSMTERSYNIYYDKLPIKAIHVDIKNLHYRDYGCRDEKLYPPCDSPDSSDFDLLSYEEDLLDSEQVPRVKVRTSSNITGSMVKKKSTEKWIVNLR